MSISTSLKQFYQKHAYFLENKLPFYLTIFCFLLIYTQDSFGTNKLTNELGMVAIFWCMITPGILLIISTFFSQKHRLLLFGLAVIFSTLVTEIDKLYFYFFQTLPSISNAKAMGQIWDVHYSIYLLINPMTFIPIIFGLFVILYPALILHYGKKSHIEAHSPPTKQHKFTTQFNLNYLVYAFVTAALLSVAILNPWQVSIAKSSNNETDNSWASNYSPIYYAAKHGIIIYHFNDLRKYIGHLFYPPTIDNQRKREINALLVKKQNLNKLDSEMYGIAKGRNIVFLQMESWAEYLIDMEINGEVVTPTANRLKNNSLYFGNIYDVTLHGRTSDAEFSIMTGLLPDVRKPAQMSHMNSYFQSLPKILKKHGYTSTAVHGHDKNFWNISTAHKKYGIDRSFFDESFTNSNNLGLGANDKDVFEFSARKFSQANHERFLGLVISLTSHHPFIDIPENYKSLFPSLRRGEGYGLLPYFLKSVRYSDDAIKHFFDIAKQQEYFNNTIFVLYGDHDPGVLNNKKTVNGLDLIAVKNDKVPVIIYIPGKESEVIRYQEKITKINGGLHDVMPTILHLLGLEIPYGVMGTHLFVSNELRSPIPLPQSPLLAIDKNVVRKGAVMKSSNDFNFREVFEEQLTVQDILDFQLLAEEKPIF